MEPVSVGIIGCGNISGTYLKTLQSFDHVRVVACADVDFDRARQRAEEFGVAVTETPDALLERPEVEVIVNLTTPNAHFDVCRAALEAGKHVHVEKPLSVTFAQGQQLAERARERNLRISVAPDTFLGGGFQTCRNLIDEGVIGQPIGMFASVLNHGHEHWHPDPAFYYQAGGGPLLDLGPYYLAILISLIGPVQSVSGAARITFPERTISSQPRHGEKITVETPTHIQALLDFEGGASGMLLTTFDVWASELPWIEVYGTEGTLSAPDPNWFGGPVRIKGKNESAWREVPLTHGFTERGNRGIGAADLCCALRENRPHRCSQEMGLHALEIMHGIFASAESGQQYALQTRCDRPAPMPPLDSAGESQGQA